MQNNFDIHKYQYLQRVTGGNLQIISYPNCSCPGSHPINLGALNGFDNGQLNICGKVCR